jgi:hypothetical protein
LAFYETTLPFIVGLLWSLGIVKAKFPGLTVFYGCSIAFWAFA